MKPKLNFSEKVVYKGIVFIRSKGQKYFRPNSNKFYEGIESLHREIWKDSFGEIPDGHDIHHKDGDFLNNNILNLECMSRSEHHKLHAKKLSLSPSFRRKQKKALEKARVAAAIWHGTDAGHELHIRLGNISWDNVNEIEKICEECGKKYKVKMLGSDRSRFCSNNCKSASRRKDGKDREVRICIVCGGSFECNKYFKTATCSQSCATKRRWEVGDYNYSKKTNQKRLKKISASLLARPGKERVCDYCGKVYIAKGYKAKFCCVECKLESYKKARHKAA